MTKKYLFILLFIHFCSVVDILDYPSTLKTIVFGVDNFEIDDNFYADMQYSFADVRIGKYKKSILVLASIERGMYLWVGPNGEKIFTKNGKIQKSYDLEHNIKFITDVSIDFNSNAKSYSAIVQLEDPKALVKQKYSLNYDSKELNIFNLSLDDEIAVNGMHKKYVEKFNTQTLKWSGENIYWVNNEGRVIRTVQNFHPKEPNIDITFYYK